MRIGQALQARDPQASASSSRLILLVCAAVVTGLTVIEQAGAPAGILAVHWFGVTVLLVLALACTVLPAEVLDRFGVGLTAAMIGVVLICLLNLLTQDTSAAPRRRSSPSPSSGRPPTCGAAGWHW